MLKRTLTYAFVLFAIFSCDEKDKEKPCVAPDFEKNIIGSWTASLESSPMQFDEVAFLDNGTFTENGGLLFGKQNEPKITWTADNDSLQVASKFSNNTTAIYAFSALENACDSIVLDVEGIDKVFLKRK